MSATITSNETDRLLSEGQAAARKGDKETARALLTQVVERDPHNEQAWMWLSGVVAEPEEQQICLENVLVINPDNAKARRGLSYISAKTGIAPNTSASGAEDALGAQPPTELTSPLDSDLARQLDPAQQAQVAPTDAQASSGPGLPDWLQAALSSGQGEQAQQAPPGEGVSSFSPDLWGGDGATTLSSDGQPPWVEPASGQHYVQPGTANAGSLSGYDLPPDLQAFTPFGETASSGPAAAGMDELGAGSMGPMGPMGPDVHLPQPNELPAFKEAANAQPWYLQGANNSNDPAEATGYLSSSEAPPKKEVALAPCPSCKEQVPETSLSCSNCRYNFFVNCPYCHELVDAVDAKPNVIEPCPYCSEKIDRFELGITGTEKGAAYISERVKSESKADKAMQKIAAKEKNHRARSVTFGWVVDILWLVAIIATVWALSQLPVWLKLTGQY